MRKSKVFFIILFISLISIIFASILMMSSTQIYRISAKIKNYEAPNSGTEYDVILFWGQSNMVGYSGVYASEQQPDVRYDYTNPSSVSSYSQLTSIDEGILSKSEQMNYVRIQQTAGTVYEYSYSNNKLVEINENTYILGEKLTYNSGTNKLDLVTSGSSSLERSGGTNMIPMFLKTYYERTGRKVVAVFAANGGEKITHFLPSTDSEYDDENQQMIYECMVEKYKAAVNYIQSNGGTIGKKYWICCQGENDVLSDTTTSEYKRLFLKVHNYLKEEIGTTKGAIVETSFTIGSPRITGVENIHLAQEQLAAENKDIIIGSTYSYDYFIPDETTYNNASFTKPKFLDSQGNKLTYQEAYQKSSYSLNFSWDGNGNLVDGNRIHFTSAALSQIGKEVAEQLSEITVTFMKNTSSTDTGRVTQTFKYGQSGNKFGYKTDGTPLWEQTGQFGQWDNPGYTLLGWSENRNAKSAQYSRYCDVEDYWIEKNCNSITLYAIWIDNSTEKVTTQGNVDRIYFFNTYSSDCTLIETQGKYGLIDASNWDETTVEGPNGQVSVTNVGGLCVGKGSQHSGTEVAKYIKNQLGITHLDFVLATHAHSDHIGGMKAIANSGLVNSNTLYFYKEFKTDYVTNSDEAKWKDYEFNYQGREAMRAKGAKLVPLNVTSFSNLSNQSFPSLSEMIKIGDNITVNDYLQGIEAQVTQNSNFTEFGYEEGGNANIAEYEDNIYFDFGNFQIRLYNLFTTENNVGENINSIVNTLKHKSNGKTIALYGDIDLVNNAENKISAAIAKDVGKIDIFKTSHHGAKYTNTRQTADLLQPKICIFEDKAYRGEAHNNACLMYYATKKYGSKFYITGKTSKAVVTTINGNDIEVKETLQNLEGLAYLKTELDSETNLVPTDSNFLEDIKHLFEASPNGVKYSWGAAENTTDWMYFIKQNNQIIPATGLYQINDNWFYSDDEGFMQIGWKQLDNKWYYFSPYYIQGVTEVGQMAKWWQHINNRWYYFNGSGEMLAGWQTINGQTYYFSQESNAEQQIVYGQMITGWKQINNKWYYFNDDGEMQVGWQTIDGKKYYFIEDLNDAEYGQMVAGWKQINNKWYYFRTDEGYGQMVTGWQQIDDKWYFFNDDGEMLLGWQAIDGKWYYFREDERYGQMVTGWQQLEGFNGNTYWFYFCENGYFQYEGYPQGSMLMGRHQILYSGTISWFYLCEQSGSPEGYERGAMVTGTYDGHTYGADGRETSASTALYTLTINPNGGTYGGTTSNSTVSKEMLQTTTIGEVTPPTYTVTFNGKGGTNPNPQTITSKFKEWNLTGLGYLSESRYIFGEGDGTLTATYDVSDNKIDELPTTTRAGYIFRGWYKDEAYTVIFNTNETITSNITLYAKWLKIEDIIETQYTLSGDMIKKVQPSTRKSSFVENITYTNDLRIKVVDKNNNELGQTDIVKTEDKLQVMDASTGNILKEFSIVVIGDVNGDGLANITDILAINKHRLNKAILTGLHLVAGDVNEDNLVNIQDILKINKYRLGKISSL